MDNKWSFINKTDAGDYCLLVKLFEDGDLLEGVLDKITISAGRTTLKYFSFKNSNEYPLMKKNNI